MLVPRAELSPTLCLLFCRRDSTFSGGDATFHEGLPVGNAPGISPSPVPPLRPIQHIWLSHRL